jgi:hypothetical protein
MSQTLPKLAKNEWLMSVTHTWHVIIPAKPDGTAYSEREAIELAPEKCVALMESGASAFDEDVEVMDGPPDDDDSEEGDDEGSGGDEE